MEKWELEVALQDLTQANIFDQSSNSRTLADVPSALVYRMVSTWAVFKDPRIQSLIHSLPPSESIPEWPTDLIPPGMLVLFMHANPKVRAWAISQALKCDIVPIPGERFDGVYVKALESIGRALTSPEHDLKESSTIAFASDASEIWHGLLRVLRFTPGAAMKSNSQQNVDLRRIVLGHVHDTGPR